MTVTWVETTTSMLPTLAEQPLRILLVEDSSADAELLVTMLNDELPEALVTVASTLALAVPLLHDPLRQDIAITDLTLPDAEGLQALTTILTARPDMAVLVMTGRSDRGLALRALAEGAEDYLVKGSMDARRLATAVLYAAQRRRTDLSFHRYERLALSLMDSMEASTCAVNADGTLIAVNRAWREFAEQNGGDPVRSGVGSNYFTACATSRGQDADAVATGLRELLEGERIRFEWDYACHSPSLERWLSVRANALPESGAVVSHVDISAIKRAERSLSHLALHDSLTGLPNRDLLVDRLEQALVWAARTGTAVGVAFLDIDQFKRVNDSLGHAAGDQLLQAISERLGVTIRDGDTLARFAGDEFVVVWPSLGCASEVELLASRLSDCLGEDILLGNASVSVTASIGVAVGQAPLTADDLLLDADAAMYDAKAKGRGLTRVYSQELRQGAEARLRIEADLRTGLSRREFFLAYQPVVDLQARKVTGVEALVRWQHPEGLRMPDEFIPIAETSGAIVTLGKWILNEACRQGAVWAAQRLDLQIAVNMSATQISHPDVVQEVEQALTRSGLRPGQLLIEVTESTLLVNAEAARAAFVHLCALGVSVAIDDFGTGYSSLLYLKRYPIAVLKIDQQFVSGMGSNQDDDAIVASVISLGRAVKATCIAEGVETAEQHAALSRLGCTHAQGFYFSRAVAASCVPAAIAICASILARPLPAVPPPVPTAEGPVPADVVSQRISELHSEGASLHTIAAALNRMSTINPTGMRWTAASVAKVIASADRARPS